MRVSQGGGVVNEWSFAEIRRRVGDGSVDPTDLYFDEDASEWLPISALLIQQAALKADRDASRACYCGSGLPFPVCHGDGTNY